VQAAAFQWVNVKGVLLAVSAVAAFTRPETLSTSLPGLVAVSALASCVSAVTWAAFGAGLSRFLSSPGVLRSFNIAMALLLLASLWPMLR
jgi:threonine/homoserine/homoserine lactone efflux protein